MRHFGLVGHPLGHSFSRTYFTEKWSREGWDCDYRNYDLDTLDLAQLQALEGFNVTIPYKETILPLLDELDPVAAEVGAVNTVKRLPDGRLKGYNTDVTGLLPTLQRFLADGTRRSALVLGTGGASKAVQYALRLLRFPYHLVSRDPFKGDYTYGDLTPAVLQDHLLIINATPVGMAPFVDVAPDLPYTALTPQHGLLDLIYNPEETLFLRKGRTQGAMTNNGLAMLHAQAEAAWVLWNDASAVSGGTPGQSVPSPQRRG